MFDSDLIVARAEALIRRVSPEGRARARRVRERRRRRVVRMARRMFFATLAILIAAVGWAILVTPIGSSGVMAVALAIFLSWTGMILFTSESEVRSEALRQIDLVALPGRTEEWLETQRPALPAPANRLIDQIGVRLEGLAPCLDRLDPREPAAVEVRRLVGEELPELVSGYQRVPQSLRRQGPDRQLLDGLRVVENELARMTEQLAAGELDKMATRGKYLELKYKGDEEVEPE